MKLSQKILFVVLAIVGIMLTLHINNALAYEAGTDFYVNNFYDYRTYDMSHPDATVQNNLGGWQVGITVFNPAMAAEISHVVINGHNGDSENPGSSTTIRTPDIYPWGNAIFNDYVLFIGVKFLVFETYDFTIYKQDGTQMFVDWNGNNTEWMTVMPGKDNALPPICEIKKMAIMKNGELKLKFTAPYRAENVNQIRIRIFDNTTGGMIYETKVVPPFEIVQKDGYIIPDMVKVFLPAEYIGHTGRIEYRMNGNDGYGPWYMLRGITYFKLPELEVE